MKKTIAILLSVLMILPTLGVLTVFADDAGDEPAETYTIVFEDYDGKVLKTAVLARGSEVRAPENPTREATETVEYIFKGWSADGGETIYHASTIPLATADVTYVAVYSEQKIPEYLTFWEFVASIFARINAVFEYFYRIFTR